MKNNLLIVAALFSGALFTQAAYSLTLPLPDTNNALVGKIISHQVSTSETIADIARHYDLGYFELLEANPHIDPKNLVAGTELVIPNQFLLPNVPRRGIIINLGTMRIFYFPKDQNYFYTYPVGIGKQDWSTPLGQLSIIEKIVDPVWRVPKSIYDYRLQRGDPVPLSMPAGPDNPLGAFALRLSKPTFLIHGTNEPASVGVRSSAGCIHLYPEDIKELFGLVAMNESVLIINQPYQAGWDNHTLYVQAYLPLAEERETLADASTAIIDTISQVAAATMQVDWHSAEETLKDHTGLPTPVGELKTQR